MHARPFVLLLALASPHVFGEVPDPPYDARLTEWRAQIRQGVIKRMPEGCLASLGDPRAPCALEPVPVSNQAAPPVMDYDSPPRPVTTVKPVYPQEAFVKKVEGTVAVEILIDATGHVAQARVVDSVPLLDQAALEAVKQWVFAPAIKRGHPVAALAHVPVRFWIGGSPAPGDRPVSGTASTSAPNPAGSNSGYELVPVSARGVRLSIPAWVEVMPNGAMRTWRDPTGDVLTLSAVDPQSPDPLFACSNEAELRVFARRMAESRGGGLIEAAMVAPPPGSVNRLIYKRLHGTGYAYTGMLIMVGPRTTLVWTAVAGERGTTGLREATVTVEMMRSGALTLESYQRSWAQDPYDPSYQGADRRVLRFLSDDERYDERFPEHPLSTIRRVLAAIPSSVSGLQ